LGDGDAFGHADDVRPDNHHTPWLRRLEISRPRENELRECEIYIDSISLADIHLPQKKTGWEALRRDQGLPSRLRAKTSALRETTFRLRTCLHMTNE
jgi:hypothetical protein